MTLRPLYAALLLVAIVFLGGIVGWWITRGALADAPRVELVAKIQSLPPAQKLPTLGAGALGLDDHLVSPGGPVWVTLVPTKGRAGDASVCRFDRAPGGGVQRPSCQPLRKPALGALFAVGGANPALIFPPRDPNGEVRAIDALTGRQRETLTQGGFLSVTAPKGTRLVRYFRAEGPKLTLESPTEGVFVGVHVAYAIIEPPRRHPENDARNFLCATPTGYVQASWRGEQLSVQFSANTNESRRVSTRVPALEQISPSFACNTNVGSFDWLDEGGRLDRVRCDPDGCRHETVSLRDIASETVVIVREVGRHTALVYERRGVPTLRLGPFEDLGRSPSAPLFGNLAGAEPPRAKDLEFVATGTSLLVFFRKPALGVAQIHENGTLEPLAPKPRTRDPSHD